MSTFMDDLEELFPEDDPLEEARPKYLFGESIEFYKRKGRIEKDEILGFCEKIPEMPNALFVYEHDYGMRFLGVYNIDKEGNIGDRISDVLYFNND